MNFSSTPTTLIIPPEKLPELPQALSEFGHPLPLRPLDPNSPTLVTLLGHKDREDSEDLRAGDLGVSVVGLELEDGKLAFSGYWSLDFLEALNTDPRMEGIEEQSLNNENEGLIS